VTVRKKPFISQNVLVLLVFLISFVSKSKTRQALYLVFKLQT